MLGLFFYFYADASPQVKKENKLFYQQITMVGILYLLSDPFIILSSYLLKECDRQYYYRFVDQSVHVVL